MMRKIGVACMVWGTVLILSSLVLLFHNNLESERAGKAADQVLPEMQAAILRQLEPPEHSAVYEETQNAGSAEMTVAEIDGQEYIGYLSIPVLGLELPVMSNWSYPKLKIAPCRQFGFSKTDNLVIAGHNYKKHFGLLSGIRADDVVQFTDMEGTVSSYRVGDVTIISANSVEAVEDSDWDLVMYTCTYSGQNRVMVGCQRLTEEELENLVLDN